MLRTRKTVGEMKQLSKAGDQAYLTFKMSPNWKSPVPTKGAIFSVNSAHHTCRYFSRGRSRLSGLSGQNSLCQLRIPGNCVVQCQCAELKYPISDFVPNLPALDSYAVHFCQTVNSGRKISVCRITQLVTPKRATNLLSTAQQDLRFSRPRA